MEKQDCTVCPVCSLYLREGITLKTHLQTHSKEKVIEALLNKHDPLNTSSDIESVSDASNQESPATVSVNLTASPELQSTSYLQSDNQLTSTTPYDNEPIQSVNNVSYPSCVNNILPQPGVGNPCNNNVSYQAFMTNEGNIVLVPVYSVCPPPVVVPSNVVSTPVVNSCLVVPPASSTVEQVDVVNSTVESSKFNSSVQSSVQPVSSSDCTSLVSLTTIKGDAFNSQYDPVAHVDCDEDEKATDEEVASIFKSVSPSRQFREEMGDDMAPEGSPCLDSESCTFETENDKPLKAPEDISNLEENNKTGEMGPATIYEELEVNSRPTSVIPSTSFDLNSCYSTENLEEMQFLNRNSVLANENHRLEPISISSSPSTVSGKDGEERYILPNNEIPDHHALPATSSDFSFLGISKSLLASSSLITSANQPIMTNVDMDEDEPQNTRTNLTNYTVNVSDDDEDGEYDDEDFQDYDYEPEEDEDEDEEEDEDDFRMNIGGSMASSSSSRISPFNIQTDESMPARGELSGPESLCSTETTVWNLQARNNLSVQRYNTSHQPETSDMKISLQSLMTEISLKQETQPVSTSALKTEEDEPLLPVPIKNKIAREFHCFYCKATFDAYKLRQTHIEDEHAEEDGLTIATLFSKRLKCKYEDEVKNEDGSITTVEDCIICRLCNTTFKTSFALLSHLKMIHDIKKRSTVCPTCFARFGSPEEYQEHIQKVHPYECMTCGKKFLTRPGYMLHQKRHMKVKPYSCDVCDKAFVTKQKLIEHVNIHTGDNPVKCELCDSTFKRYSNYQQHKKYIHMNCKRKLKDFICDCGAVFHSKMKLLWHREIHDAKPKQCPFCTERFIHKASLTRHIRKRHNELYLSEWIKSAKNVVCPICNVSYLHTSLQTHMKIHEGSKPYECTECSKSFRTKWNLKLHRWTHMSRSSKPFKCKLCVRAYIHKTDYDAHVRSHNNNRPYSCNVCGRQFIRKYNCLRHMREHNEPRAYKCGICNKMFSRSYYLTEHQKVHTGEKPHICHFCGKASATKSNHNKHVKMHTGARETINSET